MGYLTLHGQHGVRSAGQTPGWLLAYRVKRLSRSHIPPRSCCSVVVKFLYILNRELNQWEGNTAPRASDPEMPPFAFLNSLVQWCSKKESVSDWFDSDLTCFNGFLGFIIAHFVLLLYIYCEFVCWPRFAWLLKGDITKIGHKTHCFSNNSLMNDFCPTGSLQIMNKRSLCV